MSDIGSTAGYLESSNTCYQTIANGNRMQSLAIWMRCLNTVKEKLPTDGCRMCASFSFFLFFLSLPSVSFLVCLCRIANKIIGHLLLWEPSEQPQVKLQLCKTRKPSWKPRTNSCISTRTAVLFTGMFHVVWAGFMYVVCLSCIRSLYRSCRESCWFCTTRESRPTDRNPFRYINSIQQILFHADSHTHRNHTTTLMNTANIERQTQNTLSTRL